MCMGSKKQSEPQAAPVVATPPPAPSEAAVTQGSSKKQMDKFRYGLGSTVKTGARGLTGQGADLSSNQTQLKNRLGA